MLRSSTLAICLLGCLPVLADDPVPAGQPLTLIVMDPLARELSCPCVRGYAQRDYNALARFLQTRINRPVKVTFSESLVKAVTDKTEGRADIVVGKESVVRADAAALKRTLEPIVRLTGKDGATTQTGLFVVPRNDPARTMADLKDYRIVFGPPECDEKHAAARALLTEHNVPLPGKIETAEGCDVGATRVLELPAGQHGAAVISSYARPLLEGCGTVPRGSLRIVGETKPVPFVTAFVAAGMSRVESDAIRGALLDVAENAELCRAMETRGFVAPEPAAAADKAKKK
ncbi:MAG: PhnD/SsuA/transferrin family substrate-binding protein [Tepidisphaeraceae bacterium]|jgi:ABC-type phosphate/phosphonate transport system substrate-binding protein